MVARATDEGEERSSLELPPGLFTGAAAAGSMLVRRAVLCCCREESHRSSSSSGGSLRSTNRLVPPGRIEWRNEQRPAPLAEERACARAAESSAAQAEAVESPPHMPPLLVGHGVRCQPILVSGMQRAPSRRASSRGSSSGSLLARSSSLLWCVLR